MTETEIVSVTLPLSGWTFDTRLGDGMWRAYGPTAVDYPDFLETIWTDGWIDEPLSGINTVAEDIHQDTPTWWLVYCRRPKEGGVTVTLPDGTQLPVVLSGNVWACEWIGLATDDITISAMDVTMLHSTVFRRPCDNF